jgi:predicted nucleic acid-binding protein
MPAFVSLTVADFIRAVALMDKYHDAELDFVDCCLTALAERLGITGICTFDRRDFSIIRPVHTDHFELLP